MKELERIQQKGFSWLLENSQDLVIVLSASGQILFINRGALAFYKCRKTIVGTNYFDFAKKTWANKTPISPKDLILTRKRKRTLIKRVEITSIFRNKKNVIEWSFGGLRISGRKKYFILWGRELTEQRHIEHLAKSTKFNLDAIIACMPGNVYWVDKHAVFQGCNDNVAKMLGLKSSADIVGMTHEDTAQMCHWLGNQAASFKRDDLEVIRTGKSKLNIEDPLVTSAEGKTLHFLTSRMPIRGENNVVTGAVGISVDITDRKKIEEALRKAKEAAEVANQAKTEFLENIRHDLRTPLTGIVGFSDLIKLEAKKAKNEKISAYADSVQASSQALLELLNEVLEAMRIASGERPILRKKFNLKKRLKQVINLNLSKARQKKLHLLFEYDEEIPTYLIGDPQRIQRILLELLANSLNFTNEGKILVNVKLVKANRELHEVIIQISISDTGMGIPENRREEIFERFKRLTPSYEGTYKGLGLGLAIVKQFVDDIGGEIFLQSEVGKGSTFVCTLPLKEALLQDARDVDEPSAVQLSKTETLKQHLPEVIDPLTSGQPRILLVEDDPLAAAVVHSLLLDFGYAVFFVKDGASALEAFKNNHFDLVFMDVGLPDTSGYEVTRQMRQWDSWHSDKHTPIVGLTAHVDVENKERCLKSGMDAVLSKPLETRTAEQILKAFVPKSIAPKDKRGQDSPKWFILPEAIIDLAVGSEIMGGRMDAAKDMLKMLINESLPSALGELTRAYEDSDWTTIQKTAHKLHGGTSYCGAPRLKVASAYLEDYLGDSQTDLREKLYQQLINEIAALQAEYARQI